MALGERAHAAALYPLVVEGMATGSIVVFDGSHLLETVAGMAAFAGGDWRAAESHFESAIRTADTMPFVSEQAEARYWYARMRSERDGAGDRESAHALLELARAGYQSIGAGWHRERADGPKRLP